MYVEIGNDHAIEGYRDPASDDPNAVLYRLLEGEHVTRLEFPQGMGLQDAYLASVAALMHHMEDGAAPAWVESDSPGLSTLLIEHYGTNPKKTRRPAAWGKTTKG